MAYEQVRNLYKRSAKTRALFGKQERGIGASLPEIARIRKKMRQEEQRRKNMLEVIKQVGVLGSTVQKNIRARKDIEIGAQAVGADLPKQNLFQKVGGALFGYKPQTDVPMRPVITDIKTETVPHQGMGVGYKEITGVETMTPRPLSMGQLRRLGAAQRISPETAPALTEQAKAYSRYEIPHVDPFMNHDRFFKEKN